jgi:hypothetical protein
MSDVRSGRVTAGCDNRNDAKMCRKYRRKDVIHLLARWGSGVLVSNKMLEESPDCH